MTLSKPGNGKPPSSRVTSRFVNGIIAAVITVVFLVHGAMGSLSAVTGFSGSLAWVVWGAVVLALAHVVVSIVTSAQQLSDAEHPPSARKKRHLALKWATGGLLAVAAAVHIALPKSTASAAFVIVAVSALLAVHLCVGSKSLLKDLDIDRRYKVAFRVVVCVLAALFALAMLMGVA